MKQVNFIGKSLRFALIALFLSGISSCSDDNNAPDVISGTLEVRVKLQELYSDATLGVVNVELKNINTGKTTTVQTDAKGVAAFSNLPIDTYDVTATYTMPATDYATITGNTSVAADVLFSASATGFALQPGETKVVELELGTGNASGFVFKTIYQSGSDTKKGAGEDDQFIEIYNNSDRTLYADSLCIAVTTMSRYGNGHASQDKRYYYTEDGRYDWSKSEGMPQGINANDDYYYADMLFMIPGSGKDHAVKPGESIVIARFAQNYKGTFTTSSRGETKNVEDPSLTVDLSTADFEPVFKRYESLDNVNVANLELIHTGINSSMRLSRNSKQGFVLFRHPDPKGLPVYKFPAIDPAKNSNATFRQISNGELIDVVETIAPNADGYLSPKAIRAKDDAGYTYSTKGEYSSYAVSRKVIKTLSNGRRVLQDVNNSTLDFVTVKAEPRGFAN